MIDFEVLISVVPVLNEFLEYNLTATLVEKVKNRNKF